MSKKKKKKDKEGLTNFLIIVFLLLVALFLYSRYVGTKGLVVKDYTVSSDKLPSNFDGIKILHFTDLHYGGTVKMEDVKKLVNKINEIEPDLVVFTGDLIYPGYKMKTSEETKLISYFSSIDNNLGKYAVVGDNDNEVCEKVLKTSDFMLLKDQYDLIYNKGLTPIFLGGSEDSINDTIDYNKLLSYYSKERKNAYDATFKIIITHEPDNASDIIKHLKDVNMILSGHSLNGSIRIPFYGGLYYPKGSTKYGDPKYKMGNTYIFTSGGIGTENFQYRLFNTPSINVYRLKKS